jgi:hypothetical protein
MIVLVVAGLISVAMNFWGMAEADRRRRIVQGATILAGVGTVVGAVWGYHEGEKDKRELQGKLDAQMKAAVDTLKSSNEVLTKLTDLQTAHQELTSQVERVVVAAQKVKPGATPEEALDLAAQRLSADLKHLSARVDQIDTSTLPRAITPEVHRRLQAILAPHKGCTVFMGSALNDPDNRPFAMALGDEFAAAGWVPSGIGNWTNAFVGVMLETAPNASKECVDAAMRAVKEVDPQSTVKINDKLTLPLRIIVGARAGVYYGKHPREQGLANQ